MRDSKGERAINCLVTEEALLDASHTVGGATDEAKVLKLFRQYKASIHAAVDRKLKVVAFEDHGSTIVIRNPKDLTR